MALKKKEVSTTKTGATPVDKSVKKATTKKVPVKKSASSKEPVVPKKSATKKAAAKKVATKKVVTKLNLGGSSTSTAKAKATALKPKTDPVKQLADAAVEGILEVKGKNISILDLKHIHNRVCDYFIICQAESTTQVNAIAGSVEEMVKKRTGERPYRKEGFENSEWILVDYVTVVIHIFQSEIRNFYNLESLWADAEITELAFD
ncbi:MAG TPA: ribosome silencing factor [Bacteroidia bacterium]|nr:ribosome silencing factor [Bacteroidia bacterium]